jgi:hypothetical protein
MNPLPSRTQHLEDRLGTRTYQRAKTAACAERDSSTAVDCSAGLNRGRSALPESASSPASAASTSVFQQCRL